MSFCRQENLHDTSSRFGGVPCRLVNSQHPVLRHRLGIPIQAQEELERLADGVEPVLLRDHRRI